MNIKGILRSTAAKFIAFAGIVGCFAGALFLTEDTITDFGQQVLSLKTALQTIPYFLNWKRQVSL